MARREPAEASLELVAEGGQISRLNYLITQNPCASIPSAVLNLLRKNDHVRSLDNMRVTALQIEADRCAGRNPGATRFRGSGQGKRGNGGRNEGLVGVAAVLDNQARAGNLTVYLLPARHAERPGRGYFLRHSTS